MPTVLESLIHQARRLNFLSEVGFFSHWRQSRCLNVCRPFLCISGACGTKLDCLLGKDETDCLCLTASLHGGFLYFCAPECAHEFSEQVLVQNIASDNSLL